MRNLFKIFITFIFFLGHFLYAQEVIILEGEYQNRNIFVSNSPTQSGIGYCSFEVRVNGNIVTDQIEARAYEIDLTVFGLAINDPVLIEIKHKQNCYPKILNPDALVSKPTFNVVAIGVSKEGTLTWSTTDEHGKLPFVIQQYKWNKWVGVGEVQGNGTPELNKYSFIVTFISGQNKFRIVQKINSQRFRQSKSTTIKSERPKLNFVYNRRNKKVVFSHTTAYEIHDKFGQLIMRGFDSQADVGHLTKDEYYLSFDSLTEVFAKK